MTRKNISEAISNISDRHIEEVMNFRERTEKLKMEKKNNKKPVRLKWRPVLAAALVACVCLSGATALAATGALQGFFENVFGWNGAVVGTSYEQASNEVELEIVEVTNELVVELTMLYPDKAPYRELEVFGIESYNIVDEYNNVIKKGTTTEMKAITDGNVLISIPLENLPSGTYKLIVHELVGEKKADQPLILSGSWECDFVR